MKQNGVVCQPGFALSFFVFRYEYLISGLKSYRDFRSGSFYAPDTSLCQKYDERSDWREIKENMQAFACFLFASFLNSVYFNCLLLKAE